MDWQALISIALAVLLIASSVPLTLLARKDRDEMVRRLEQSARGRRGQAIVIMITLAVSLMGIGGLSRWLMRSESVLLQVCGVVLLACTYLGVVALFYGFWIHEKLPGWERVARAVRLSRGRNGSAG